jgi:acetyl-CoA synthetase
MTDYAACCSAFSWPSVRGQLAGLPGGIGLNVAYEAVDRYQGSSRDVVAVRWFGRNGVRRDITYGELAALGSRFANVLAALGVQRGDVVCTLLGRVPALCAVALGTLKHRAVFCPLTAALGPEQLAGHLEQAAPKVLVTTRRLYTGKVRSALSRVSSTPIEHVLLIDDAAASHPIEGTLAYPALMQRASATYEIGPTAPSDPAFLHFARGVEDGARSVLHAHEAVLLHYVTGQYVLDLRAGDVFWCTADPGWVVGTAYGLIAPLTSRATLVLDEAEFDVGRCHELLERERVSVFYTCPEAIRALTHATAARSGRGRDLSALRSLACAGSALEPDSVMASQAVFGVPCRDTWSQTEAGGILIANFPANPIKPGSIGRPIPGVQADVVRRRRDGSLERIKDGVGELALRGGWPSMFRGYHGPDARASRRAGEWYLSGDIVRRDEDGDFFFVGRAGEQRSPQLYAG